MTTLILQPGGVVGLDANLRESTPDANGGGSSGFYARLNEYTGVIKFAGLSAIGSILDANIQSATLYLTLYAALNNETAYYFHRSLRAWVESEVTWNSWKTGSSWSTGGGIGSGTDRAATAMWSGSLTTDLGEKSFSLDLDEFNLMRANNNGMIHWASGGTGTQYRFYRSSDYSVASERPRLVVEYLGGGSQIIRMQ